MVIPEGPVSDTGGSGDAGVYKGGSGNRGDLTIHTKILAIPTDRPFSPMCQCLKDRRKHSGGP